MSLNAKPILDKLASIALATGKFARVNQYEPRGQPPNGLSLDLISGPIVPIRSSGLNRVSLRWQIDGRINHPLTMDPPERLDPLLTDAAAHYFELLCGQFTLGGLVRTVDVFGMDGGGLDSTPGYLEHNGKVYRVAQLVIPLLINETWTLTP